MYSCNYFDGTLRPLSVSYKKCNFELFFNPNYFWKICYHFKWKHFFFQCLILFIADHLKTPLDDYLRTHFEPSKVRLERMFPRSGLIQARMRGAVVARGTVLTFLDSHCEATTGWLEPLLAHIAKDRSDYSSLTPILSFSRSCLLIN